MAFVRRNKSNKKKCYYAYCPYYTSTTVFMYIRKVKTRVDSACQYHIKPLLSAANWVERQVK